MSKKRFNITSLITNLIIALLYPIAKTVISKNKILVLSDSLMITGLFFVLFGVFNWLYLSGDFDITVYIAKKSFRKIHEKDYNTFYQNQQEQRKGSFNYPLFVGILMIASSIILSLFA